MSYDLSKAIGHQKPSQPVAWNRRDVLLYATGIGCKANDLHFVYELDKSFAVFPTYPVVLGFRGTSHDVIDFNKAFVSEPIPGLPALNPARVVHATQSTEILRPLPVESGEGWKLTNRIIGVHENKSGIIVEQEVCLVDPQGTPYTRMISGSFNLGAKATGKPFSKAILKAPTASKPIPDRAADFVHQESTTPEQAIIYRLSGDYNPLHIDPSIGQRAGFGGVILHGLGSYGFAARAILNLVGGNDPNGLKAIAARFTSPVKPGDVLETSLWELGTGPNGTTEYAFQTKNLTSGKICLGAGVAHVIRKEKSKL